MIKTRTLNTHKCGSSRNCLRLHIISGRYDNTQEFLRGSKDFSTVMRSSKYSLRVMRILEGPGEKIKSCS